MARKSKHFQISPVNALALAIEVYNDQGFIRSGEGFKSIDTDSARFQEQKITRLLLLTR